MIEASEECDDANADDADACIDCTLARCGDGIIQTGVETCDDSNLDPHDDCTASCQVAICGDGVIKAGEICDDGNSVDDDWCANDCTANDRQEWFDEIGSIGATGYPTEARDIVAKGEETWVTGPYSDQGVLGYELFVIGYDAAGTRLQEWRYRMTDVSIEPHAIMFADDGDLVIAGEAETGSPDTSAFVAKFGLDGTLRWTDVYEHPSGEVRVLDAIPTGNGSFAVGGHRYASGPGHSAWIREYADDGTILEDWDYQIFDDGNRVDAMTLDGEGGYVFVRAWEASGWGVSPMFRVGGDGTHAWFDPGWHNRSGYYLHYFGDVLRAPDGTFFTGGRVTRSTFSWMWPSDGGFVAHYTATGGTIGVTHYLEPQEGISTCKSMEWKGSGGGFYCAASSVRDDLDYENVVELMEFDEEGAIVQRVPIDISPFFERVNGLAVTPSDRLVIAVNDGTGSNGAWVGSYAG